jgi:hypothetical protein
MQAGDSPLQMGPKQELSAGSNTNPFSFLFNFLMGTLAGSYYFVLPVYMCAFSLIALRLLCTRIYFSNSTKQLEHVRLSLNLVKLLLSPVWNNDTFTLRILPDDDHFLTTSLTPRRMRGVYFHLSTEGNLASRSTIDVSRDW